MSAPIQHADLGELAEGESVDLRIFTWCRRKAEGIYVYGTGD